MLKLLCYPHRQQVQVKNPYLDTMEEDILYHFSLSTKTHNLPQMFGDVKVSEKEVLENENAYFQKLDNWIHSFRIK